MYVYEKKMNFFISKVHNYYINIFIYSLSFKITSFYTINTDKNKIS